jgi:hypothetical protein
MAASNFVKITIGHRYIELNAMIKSYFNTYSPQQIGHPDKNSTKIQKYYIIKHTTDICRIFNSMAEDSTFFLATHRTFSKIDCI